MKFKSLQFFLVSNSTLQKWEKGKKKNCNGIREEVEIVVVNEAWKSCGFHFFYALCLSLPLINQQLALLPRRAVQRVNSEGMFLCASFGQCESMAPGNFSKMNVDSHQPCAGACTAICQNRTNATSNTSSRDPLVLHSHSSWEQIRKSGREINLPIIIHLQLNHDLLPFRQNAEICVPEALEQMRKQH